MASSKGKAKALVTAVGIGLLLLARLAKVSGRMADVSGATMLALAALFLVLTLGVAIWHHQRPR